MATRNDEMNGDGHGDHQSHGMGMYLRFGAMILTAMVVMYGVMFVSSYEWSHIRTSQSRMFMALTMGGTMGLIMLAWMLNMYENAKANVAIVVASLVLLGVGAFLDRSQTTVGDTAFMSAMIPHHSMAITRAERFEVDDIRVCQLAVEISEAQRREILEAQRREILEMDWLIDDIRRNGVAATAEEAQARPVPDYEEPAERQCPAG
jgi:cytochrome c oxidase subunit IV